MLNGESFLRRWSRFFVTRYRISILILIAIVIAGLWGAYNNQRQDFPVIPLNFAIVTATYPGASPEDVEQEVLVPIEQAAANLKGVDYIRSSASNSFGTVEVVFEDVNKTDENTTKFSDELGKLRLPDEVETDILTFDATGPVLALGLVGTNGKTTADLLPYAEEVRSRLENSSSEISRVEISPSNEFEVQVVLEADKMQEAGLSFDVVKTTLQSQIIGLPGGTVEDADGRRQAITITAPVQTLENLENVQLGRVKLADIAAIKRVPKQGETIHYIGYTKDGQAFAKESVYFLVYKKDDGDIIRIAEAVMAEVGEIKANGTLPDDVDLVKGYDASPYVQDQIDSLLNNGYLGLIIILIVLLFFINLRTAVVVALVIPIVFLITFFALAVLGYSLNILTLFAMILTLGILVDNAIVIAEGMVHELEKGASKKRAALTAVKKLGPAVTAATLTTFVVFIPFARIGGLMGEFLKYIPYTIMIVIAASYFVAISITPLMGRWFLKEQTYEERRKRRLKGWHKLLILPLIVFYGQRVIDRLSFGYRNLMKYIFQSWKRKIIVIIVIIILIGISFGYYAPKLTFEQFPSKDSTAMQVNFTFPAGTPHDEQKDVFLKAMDELVQVDYFENFYFFHGVVYATFTDPVYRTDETTIYDLEDDLDERLDTVRTEISEDIQITPIVVSYGPPEEEYDLIVEFTDNDRDDLDRAADDLTAWLQEKDSVSEIYNGPKENLVSSIDVDLDQPRLNEKQVNSMVAAGTVNAVFAPQTIGSLAVREDGVSDDLVLEFSETSTDSVEDLQKLYVPTLAGRVVQLEEVADINQVSNPVNFQRLDGERVAKISVKLKEGADRAALDQEMRDYLSASKLEELGLSKDGVTYGGEFAAFESDFSKLQIVFLLAVIAVYLILVYQFYSYIQPALIIFAIPLALIGVFPGLLLVGSTLNMMSGLGVIALVGIVVNDAIVLIATYNRYRQEHPDESNSDVLVRTGFTRFKPIFSTSITTIGGILPLTIRDPFWTGLGTSIIAGLIFSTVGTLIAIPVLYSIWCSMMSKLKFKRQKAPPTADPLKVEKVQVKS